MAYPKNKISPFPSQDTVFLKAILDSSTEAIYSRDLAGYIRSWNESAERIYHYTEAEVIGEPLSLIVPDDKMAEFHQLMTEVQKGKQIKALETTRKRKDGSILYVSLTLTPLRNKNGEIVGVSVVAKDISEEKKSKEERDLFLRELALTKQKAELEKEKLYLLFMDAPALVALHEGSDHKYIFSNKLHNRLTGNRKLIGKSLREAFPEVETEALDRYDFVFHSGQQVVTPVLQITLDRSGSGKPEKAFFHHILQPSFSIDGKVEGVMSFSFDITEEVQTRKRLEQAESRYRKFIEDSPAGIFVYSDDGEVQVLNRKWTEITGYGKEDIPTVFEWFKLAYQERAYEKEKQFRELAGTNQIFTGDLEFYSKKGEKRHLTLTSVPAGNLPDGRALSSTMVIDATHEHLYKKKLEEANRQKDEFLALLGHELRNPLAAISSWIELQKRIGGENTDLNEKAQEVIARQAHHMNRLIDELLDVSRIMRGKIQLNMQPLSIHELVQATLDDNAQTIKNAGLQLVSSDVKAKKGQEAWIHGDRIRLSQAISNLLSNAIKFTPQGGVITVSLEQKKGRILIKVRDSGTGIPKHLQEKIFEPFQQIEPGLAHSKGGLGLGLALVKGLVELHEGRISVTSQGAKSGSEFTIELPLAPKKGPAPDQEESLAKKSMPHIRRVLLVEDEPDSREALQTILEFKGYQVRSVSTGEEAIRAAKTFEPQILICDVGLPGKMSGYDVARKLRSETEDKKITLIAVTGYGQAQDKEIALKAGFNRHFTKPVDIQELEKFIVQQAFHHPTEKEDN
jgi:PAS domain S-box-containing protein